MILLKEKLRLLRYLKLTSSPDLARHLILFLARHIKWPNDILWVQTFFSTLYDELYHEIMFKKIPLQKGLLRIFEALALPAQAHTEKQRSLIYQQIRVFRQTLRKQNLSNKIPKPQEEDNRWILPA